MGAPVAADGVKRVDLEQRIDILLVDDRAENLRALEAVLESPAYNLVKAESGVEALRQVLLHDFAAILLDVQMPEMDGFETATLIRKRHKSRHIPILFVTAISKEEPYVCKGYSVGAVDYIFKPFDPDVLRAKINVFVDLFRKSRQIERQAKLLRQSEKRERDRQLADLKLRSERRYRNLADSIAQIVWTANARGRLNYVNRRGIDYAGTAVGVRQHLLRDLVHPQDHGRARVRWRTALREGGAFSFEARLKRDADQAYRWHLIQVVPESDADGVFAGWLGTATDIDDQKRIEQALAAEKERLAVTLRSIGDGVITADVDGRVVLLNGAAERLTGWIQARAAGQPLAQVFNVQGAAMDEWRATDDGRDVESGAGAILASRDGSTRMIAYTSAPIRCADGVGLGVVLVFRDVTDAHRLEEERQKASKLESIGMLAGAIAHDFNNMLTAIMGNISLARLYAEESKDVRNRLGDAENAIMWAKDLTQQLLTFAKGGTPVRKRCSTLGRLVQESAEFAARGSHLRCEVELEEQLWLVDIDEGQMRQVVHNLVINAQQAMPVEGEIYIKVGNALLGDARLTLPPGRYVKISCEDRGVGIAPEHLPKIFDPYFTTKQKGSGLGLATAYSIVKRHDGLILVESEVARGTVFHIYLPAADGTAQAEVAMPTPPMSGQGRILIMDDEPRIRDMLGRMLSHFGYELEFASDGAEAIQSYAEAKRRGVPFDVVIMDLMVPGGMGGKEAIKKLLDIDPLARAIVSSGYSNDPIVAEFQSFGFCEAVAKPYRHEELREVLHRVISDKTHGQRNLRLLPFGCPD